MKESLVFVLRLLRAIPGYMAFFIARKTKLLGDVVRFFRRLCSRLGSLFASGILRLAGGFSLPGLTTRSFSGFLG